MGPLVDILFNPAAAQNLLHFHAFMYGKKTFYYEAFIEHVLGTGHAGFEYETCLSI